jgi:group II intron reverse transcriptase/maturase
MGNTEGALKPEGVSTKQRRIAELARANPKMAFTSLSHHIDEEWLRYAFDLTRKDGAVGVDGQRAAEYEMNLEENLRGLLGRIKSGSYRAPPVRRALIPKADGKMRPLGIPTFEDKVAQRAIALLLEPIYEHDFLPCSFGFRPGKSPHQALNELRSFIMENNSRWVLDVDLRAYFDTIDHAHLRSLLARRVVDGVIRRMIDKWLKAGVLDNGQLHRAKVGTPQGGVISPLLANIFLHYVLDEWFATDVKPRMKRKSALVRYCDDFVLVFEDFLDCRRVLAVLGKRVGRFGLSLHPEKTCMVDFRFKRPNGQRHAATQGTTFDFLGFTHIWGLSRNRKNVVYQVTAKARFTRALRAVKDWCRRWRHSSLTVQHARLSRMVLGHYAYYGVTGNHRRLRWYLHQVERIWWKWLSRRSRANAIPGRRFDRILKRYPLPPTRIVHRYAATSESAP